MKKYYSFITLLGLSLTASAVVNHKGLITESTQVKTPDLETISPLHISRSATNPESEFTANQARFYYYHDFYKDGTTACYQIVLTNSDAGFSSGGTLPAGPGQLVCLFLCGPQSEDKDNPILPAGTYKFAKAAGEAYTFSTSYGHYIDAFYETSGGLTGWQLQPEGGEIVISVDNGVYDVKADLNVGYIDEITDEEMHIAVSTSYKGKITVPGPFNELPGENYVMDLTGLSGMVDASQKLVALTFYGCELDKNGFIVGKGDLLNVFIYYTGNTPLADLPGTYSYAPYLEPNSWTDNRFIGGYYFDYGIIIPTGTYCAHYNDSGVIDACGFCGGGTIDVKAVGAPSDGNLSFDFNLEAQSGTKITGSWSGNIYGKVTGLETTGIDDIINNTPAIIGMTGRVEAPVEARVFTTSGLEVGHENLNPGLYIVLYNGKSVKVVVR